MIPLWPSRAERVVLDTDEQGAFALHLPAASPTRARPVVLVHGFRGCALEWGPLAERLARTRDVWVPQLVSSTNEQAAGLREVHALLDGVRALAAPDGRVDVMGSSMGGYVATSWAAAREDVVGRLSLLAPALVPLQRLWVVPGVTRLIATQRALDADEARWEKQTAAATIDDFFTPDAAQPGSIPPDWRRAVLDHQQGAVGDAETPRRVMARQAVVRSLMTTLRTRGAVQRLVRQVSRPVLWLHGDADARVPFGPSRHVAAGFPRSAFLPLPGIGHLPHLECPNLVTRHLEQWDQAVLSEA